MLLQILGTTVLHITNCLCVWGFAVAAAPNLPLREPARLKHARAGMGLSSSRAAVGSQRLALSVARGHQPRPTWCTKGSCSLCRKGMGACGRHGCTHGVSLSHDRNRQHFQMYGLPTFARLACAAASKHMVLLLRRTTPRLPND